jgi:hypothetical protein
MSFDIAEFNLAGQVYTACSQVVKAVTLINTKTVTGLILVNPWGSGKKLILSEMRFAHSTVPTATSVLFLCLSAAPSSVTVTTTSGSLNIYGADGSGATGKSLARAFNACVTPEFPVYSLPFSYAPTTPALEGDLSRRLQLDGAIVLVPGSFASLSYLGEAATGIGEVVWAEVDA